MPRELALHSRSFLPFKRWSMWIGRRLRKGYAEESVASVRHLRAIRPCSWWALGKKNRVVWCSQVKVGHRRPGMGARGVGRRITTEARSRRTPARPDALGRGGRAYRLDAAEAAVYWAVIS